MNRFTPSLIGFFQKSLPAWFAEHQRPLPWRKTYDPYQVWISEIMLQQTQVKTALPYFERWIQRFPTIRSVATAKEEAILKSWEGLGYYSRARNLQKAAQMMVEKNDGKLFDRYDELLTLPGVGRYTAGAIASIAYNLPYPVVDGNVIRVLARLLNYSKNTKTPASVEFFWKRATELLPRGHAREFNQGMMELGALVCTSQNPKCAECPLRKQCAAYAEGMQEILPNRGIATEKIELDVAAGIIFKKGKILIQKRLTHGLMAGLWEFPGGKIETGETPKQALRRELKEELGITVKKLRPFIEIQHSYTKFKVHLHCFVCNYANGRIRLTAATRHRWAEPKELKKLPFPSADVKIINCIVAWLRRVPRSKASR
ncbi:A/G-specific adenine glycosylase [Candidatus Peregrinibacteria bacterium]|nr:A/G-specific adenine glycosylase [Candidatus Peregrinibacteria bacterium]